MPKTSKLNVTHYFIMKIPCKRELQHIASNHLCDIEFKNFMKLYKDYTKEKFSFLVNNATLLSDNPLKFFKKTYDQVTVSKKIKTIGNRVE